MDWEKVKTEILSEAKAKGKSHGFIDKYLEYAFNLHSKNLPIISDSIHLAMLIGIDPEYLHKMAFKSKKFYRQFKIKKSDGSDRVIDEPLPDLKYVQRWILKEILYKVEVSPYAKAYVPKLNIKHNAKFHKSQVKVVSLDIKNFFPSIKFFDVYSIFTSLGYTKNLSILLANLCCLNGSLPQGSPTSPCLSNIRMTILDFEIFSYCSHNNWRYTRYSDDMSFSGAGSASELIKYISSTVYRNGFQINSKKTRVANRNARQEVTGIVVNEKLQIPREKRREIRKQIHYIKRYGLESHLLATRETRSNYLHHLSGQIGYALFVNPSDQELRESFEFIKSIDTIPNNSEQDRDLIS